MVSSRRPTPHTTDKTKKEIARRQDQEIGGGTPHGAPQTAERQEKSEQKINPIASKIGLREPYVIQNIENSGIKEHEPTRQEALQVGIDRRGPKKWGIRYEGNQDKGKYGAGRGGDDQDAAGKKFTAGAPAKLPSANNQRRKKTAEAKEGNDGRLNELNDIKEKVGRKNATGAQSPAYPCKKMAGAIRETKEIKDRPKGGDSLRAEIKKDRLRTQGAPVVLQQVNRRTGRIQRQENTASRVSRSEATSNKGCRAWG